MTGQLKEIPQEEIKSTGFIVNTLEASLWVTLNSNTYEEAVVKAVNLGGDTDTIGAITGGLNGIIYKYRNIPKKWIDVLKKGDYLTDLSVDFTELLMKNKT